MKQVEDVMTRRAPHRSVLQWKNLVIEDRPSISIKADLLQMTSSRHFSGRLKGNKERAQDVAVEAHLTHLAEVFNLEDLLHTKKSDLGIATVRLTTLLSAGSH